MPANIALSLSESDLYQALGDVLQGLFTDVKIVRSQQNAVSMPVGDFITMTSLHSTGLSTGVVTYTAPVAAGPGTQQITRTTQWRCQLDFYGQTAARHALTFATLIRFELGTDVFRRAGNVICPLYCSEPHQTTMINGEQQYEPRWTLDIVAQIHPVVSAPLAFFDSVTLKTTITESLDGHSNQ